MSTIKYIGEIMQTEKLTKKAFFWTETTEQFGKDSYQVLPKQSWIVFDDLSSEIFAELESQILGRCQNLTLLKEFVNCNFMTKFMFIFSEE